MKISFYPELDLDSQARPVVTLGNFVTQALPQKEKRFVALCNCVSR